MNPPPRILPLHSFFFSFFTTNRLTSTPWTLILHFQRDPQNEFNGRGIFSAIFSNSRDRGDNLIQGREVNLEAAGVGANFKKSGGRPSLAGPVTAIETTYLVVETRMAGLSFPSPPTVWTPDFPLRRLPLLLITCRQIQFAEQ